MSFPVVASFRSVNSHDRFIRHRNFLAEITPISSDLDGRDASFIIVPGLADRNHISFMSSNFNNFYLRHYNFRLRIDQRPRSSTRQFDLDATFIWRPAEINRTASLFESFNFNNRYIRHRNFELWLDQRDGTSLFMRDSSFHIVNPFINPRAEGVRLHLKVLTLPAISLDTMVASMREVYGMAGITVDVVTIENLNLPLLNNLDVGQCIQGTTTQDQNQLFTNLNFVGANEIVVYFVQSTIPPLNGCATHPAGTPGAVVAQGATRWTLAHEVGHVLELDHVNNNDRLMTGNGTANITNPPPDIVDVEVNTILASNLTNPT
jgi:hypothetical protein